jgi:hypothetical protein
VPDYYTVEYVYNDLNKTFIQTVWAELDCGDGVCDRPVEFEKFERFSIAAPWILWT